MSVLRIAFFSGLVFFAAALPARAGILIQVDQSTQTMSVDVNGRHLYDWRVSTGRPGYDTPNGTFVPNRMDANHFSQEFNNAPMPHAIFFDLDGDAIHGTFEPVGRPAASHGCVRLSPRNATILFGLVAKVGLANTKVEIQGDVQIALINSGGSRSRMVVTAPELGAGDLDGEQFYRPSDAYERSPGRPTRQQYVPYSPSYGPPYGTPW